MKTIRMKTTLAGPEMTVVAGSEIEVEEIFARKLIAGGYAELVETEAPAIEQLEVEIAQIETAETQAPEQALNPRGRAKKKK